MSHPEEKSRIAVSLGDEVGRVIDQARDAVYGGSPVEPFVADALETIPATVEETADYSPAVAAIQQLLQAGERLQRVLRESLKQIEALEVIRLRRDRYSERRQQQQRQELLEAFQSDPAGAVDRWLQTFTPALLDWELDYCEKLAQEAFPFPRSAAELPALFQQGVRAIKYEIYPKAAEMATYLVEAKRAGGSSPLLDPLSQALLLIFRGRISLHHSTSPERALADFQQAKELAPSDGRPLAALAEYYRKQDDARQAMRFCQQAIERSPDVPDGYLVMALLAEDQKRWDEAEEWYERAVEKARNEKDLEVGLSKLLTPVSANLYLHLARRLLQEERERALGLVTRAIERGIKADGDYPERAGYQLKGEILEALQRPVEAAEAYYEASQRFSWVNDYQGWIAMLERARSLNPDDFRLYWSEADALRVLSYSPIPQEINKDKLNQSVALWEQGAAIKLPDARYSWAYVVRALINYQLSDLPQADRWTLWWEGVAYLERAILLNKKDSYRWSDLSRFFRALEVEANALEAINEALKYLSENRAALITVLDEQAAIMANTGQFTEAEEVITRRLEIESNPWANAVKAYILLHNGKYGEALDLIQDSIKADQDNWWYRELRALVYNRLGLPSQSEEESRWIWGKYHPDDVRNKSMFGWAAYSIGLVDEAIRLYRELLEDPAQDPGSLHRNLGLCYLAQGQLAVGEEHFTQGLALAKNRRELDDLLELELKDLERTTDGKPHGAQIPEIISRLLDRIAARRFEINAQPSSAQDELRKALAKPEGQDGWPWVGAQAGLARLLLKAERWAEAAEIYQELERLPDRFPEAGIGLTQAVEGLQAAGDQRLQTGHPREALDHYTRLLELLRGSSPDNLQKQAELHSRQASAAFALNDLTGARAAWIKALELSRESGSADPGASLSAASRALLSDAGQYWKLMDEWAVFQDEAGAAEPLRQELAAARKSLADYLDELYLVKGKAGTGSGNSPIITPVVVEMARDLIPEDTGENWPVLKTYIPEMRERIEQEMGVVTPGVLLRAREDLPGQNYLILLDEIPLVMGQAKIDERYCLAAPAELHQLGIPDQALLAAAHPVTGSPGCWVAREYWSTVVGRQLPLWEDPLQWMIVDLEAVLRANLADFLGVQEVENLIEKWANSESGAESITATLPDQASRLRFARVLRALVKEGVPITPWTEILAAAQNYASDHPGQSDLNQIVSAVRLQLKRLLTGNHPEAKRLELPSDLETLLSPWLQRQAGKTFLAMPPEETQDFLSAMRELIDSTSRNQVLVTRNAELRPFLRRLVELEFPRLAVMTQEELLLADELSARAGEDARAESAKLEEGQTDA